MASGSMIDALNLVAAAPRSPNTLTLPYLTLPYLLSLLQPLDNLATGGRDFGFVTDGAGLQSLTACALKLPSSSFQIPLRRPGMTNFRGLRINSPPPTAPPSH
jgi:hypothetical protein